MSFSITKLLICARLVGLVGICLLTIMAFVGPDGETVYLRIANGQPGAQIAWLVAVAFCTLVVWRSHMILKLQTTEDGHDNNM